MANIKEIKNPLPQGYKKNTRTAQQQFDLTEGDGKTTISSSDQDGIPERQKDRVELSAGALEMLKDYRKNNQR